MGLVASEDSDQRFASTTGCFRQVFSLVNREYAAPGVEPRPLLALLRAITYLIRGSFMQLLAARATSLPLASVTSHST